MYIHACCDIIFIYPCISSYTIWILKLAGMNRLALCGLKNKTYGTAPLRLCESFLRNTFCAIKKLRNKPESYIKYQHKNTLNVRRHS
jgi:hypothetical protein